MKYALFLLKMRQSRWIAALLSFFCMLSLVANILLSCLLLNARPVTIFVPTNTGESFLYNGHFSPLYFERIAMFLSQRLLSFYPQASDLPPLDPFIHPLARTSICKQHDTFMALYKTKHVQGFFAPQSAVFTSPDSVTVHGSVRLFVDKRFLREHPLKSTLSFAIVQGKCLLKSLEVTPHNTSQDTTG